MESSSELLIPETAGVGPSEGNDRSVPPSSSSRPESTASRPIIPWKEPALKKVFLGLVHREQAYKRTAESYSQKFDVIAAELMRNHVGFKRYGRIRGSALEKQFRRYRDGLLKQITSDTGEIQTSTVDRLSEEDKLLFKMIAESNDSPGNDSERKPRKVDRKRPSVFFAESSTTLSERDSSTAAVLDESGTKRGRSTAGEQHDTPLDSPDHNSPRGSSRQQNLSYEDLLRCVDRAAARVACPDLLESIARDVKETQEVQRFQADALKTLMNTAVEINSRIGALNSSVNKIVELMTELVRLQKAR